MFMWLWDMWLCDYRRVHPMILIPSLIGEINFYMYRQKLEENYKKYFFKWKIKKINVSVILVYLAKPLSQHLPLSPPVNALINCSYPVSTLFSKHSVHSFFFASIGLYFLFFSIPSFAWLKILGLLRKHPN